MMELHHNLYHNCIYILVIVLELHKCILYSWRRRKRI